MIADAMVMRGAVLRASHLANEETPKAMFVAAKRTTPDIAPVDRPVAGNVVAMPRRQVSGRPKSGNPAAVVATAGAATSDETADDDLLSRIAHGEATAFSEMMQRHLSAVLATARRIVRDHAEAEDIAQEAFLRLWNSAKTLEVGANGMRPWLRRVASNLAIDWLRKAKRLDVTDAVPEQIDEPDQVRALEAVEATVRVEGALASLPPRQRIAVCLFHFEEMSQREVAQMMDLSEDALESLLARGRRRLRESLKDDWQELLDVPGNQT